MGLIIRPFTPDDYPAVVAVENAVWPEYADTVEEVRFYDEHRDPKVKWARWMMEWNGETAGIAGYTQAADLYHPQKFWIGISVRPEYQGQGIGKAAYHHVLEALQTLDPILVRSQCREDMARSVRFLQDRGFQEEERSWESRLDVASFDFAPYEEAEKRICEARIEIKTYSDLEGEPNHLRKLYDLDNEVSADMPLPDPWTPVDFDHYCDRTAKNPNLLKDAFFVAVHNGEYVGTSALWSSQDSDHLFTGLTGVKREYRGKGIALALKLRAIAYAQERGCPVIRTWNSTLNRPMLSINERLGFVKQPAWIGYRKDLV